MRVTLGSINTFNDITPNIIIIVIKNPYKTLLRELHWVILINWTISLRTHNNHSSQKSTLNTAMIHVSLFTNSFMGSIHNLPLQTLRNTASIQTRQVKSLYIERLNIRARQIQIRGPKILNTLPNNIHQKLL